MPKDQFLIRSRTPQERMRRRLLLTGIPLLAVGVALAWIINNAMSPNTEQDTQSSIQAAPLAPIFTTTVMADFESTSTDSHNLAHNEQDIEVPSDKQALTETTPLALQQANNESTSSFPDEQNQRDTVSTATTVTENIPPITATTVTENITPPPAEKVTDAESDVTQEPDTAVVTIIEPDETPSELVSISRAPRVALPKNFDSLSDSRLVKAHAPAVTYVSYQTLARLTPNNTLMRLNTNNIASNTERGRRGWIYAGKFSNGTWLERGLLIDNKLPTPGQRYQLTWGAKLRDNPPGRSLNNGKALGDEIGFLNSGKSIQVVQVRNSGNSGHIWLQVSH